MVGTETLTRSEPQKQEVGSQSRTHEMVTMEGLQLLAMQEGNTVGVMGRDRYWEEH